MDAKELNQAVRNHLKTIEVISEQSLVNLQFYTKSLQEEVIRLEENYLKFTGKQRQSGVYKNDK